jgi:hypothetical protein
VRSAILGTPGTIVSLHISRHTNLSANQTGSAQPAPPEQLANVCNVTANCQGNTQRSEGLERGPNFECGYCGQSFGNQAFAQRHADFCRSSQSILMATPARAPHHSGLPQEGELQANAAASNAAAWPLQSFSTPRQALLNPPSPQSPSERIIAALREGLPPGWCVCRVLCVSPCSSFNTSAFSCTAACLLLGATTDYR